MSNLTKIKQLHDGNRVSEKTLSSWKNNFPWLKINTAGLADSVVRLKCSICEEFKMKTIWADEGTANVQKSTIERHCVSEPHGEATRRSIRQNMLAENSKMLKKEDLTDINISNSDVFLIRTVYMEMKEEMPLEKVNAVLDLQRLNKADMPYRNLSWTTITEIQSIIAGFLKKDLPNKLRHSMYFAVLIDESTAITVSKRLSICVRYVNAGRPQTAFLGNVELEDGCAHTITTALLSYFEQSDIDASKCVSLSTDEASVMMGKKTGVGVQFQAKAAPFSVQTHCIAHRLNLAVTESMKHVDALKKFSEKFGQLYNYISASGNRTYALKQMQTLLDEP